MQYNISVFILGQVNGIAALIVPESSTVFVAVKKEPHRHCIWEAQSCKRQVNAGSESVCSCIKSAQPKVTHCAAREPYCQPPQPEKRCKNGSHQMSILQLYKAQQKANVAKAGM